MYELRGKAFLSKKGFFQAANDFTQAISLDPRNEGAFFFRGAAKFEMKDYVAALNETNQAITINPNKSAYFGFRANLHSILGNQRQVWLDEKESSRLKSLGK